MDNYYNIIPLLFAALIIGAILICIIKPMIYKEGFEEAREGFSAGNELRIAAIEYYLENVSSLITNPADYALIRSNINGMLKTIKEVNISPGTLTTGDVQEEIFQQMVEKMQTHIDDINLLLTDTDSKPKLKPGFHQIMDSLRNNFVGPPY